MTMKWLYLSTCLFFLTGSFAQDAFLEEFAVKWEGAKSYTLEVAERMPESAYDFRPTPEQMSFREQLLHMMSNMVGLSQRYLDAGDWAPVLRDTSITKTYDKELLLRYLGYAYEYVGESVIELDSTELNKEVDFFAGPKSVRQIINLLDDHSTHHRGQLMVYLRLNGLEPPRYRGW